MRRVAAVVAVVAAIVLPQPDAGAATVVIEGHGVVLGGNALCATPPGPAPVHLTFTSAVDEPRPIARWHVALVVAAPIACPVADIADCTGTGTLAQGIVIDGCRPLAGSGSLAPVVVCIPGPARPGAILVAHPDFAFTFALGSFAGPIDLVLAGDAVDEVSNTCD